MIAMIFAAGLGTRLKPFTLHHPKALVEIDGIPMLERVIINIKNFGIDKIVVNVHHFASQITDFLKSNNNFGCDITISDESKLLLDTGGGLLHAKQWLQGADEPILVHNADILTDLPLHLLYKTYRHANGPLAVLAVSERVTSRYLLFDNNMRMCGWTNKQTGQTIPPGIDANALNNLAFGGIHIVSPQIFPLLEQFSPGPTVPFSIMDFYKSKCQDVNIWGYQFPKMAMWYDIGKPDALERARKAL